MTSAFLKVAENPNLLLLRQASKARGVAYVRLIAPESGLSKFNVNAQNYRGVVLDGKVVSSIIYLPIEGDIRTNATKVPVTLKAEISDEWKAIAIRVAEQKRVAFGRIDLSIDESGQPFVAEMNTPCHFSRCEKLTGDPIAAQLIHFLC